MDLRVRCLLVLSAVGGLFLASGTSHEKPLLGAHGPQVTPLEVAVAEAPADGRALRSLAQAYLDAQAPGLALSTIERAPASLRSQPAVDHMYARALLDQGRAADALLAEHRVLDRCAAEAEVAPACDSWLIASATRRADILRELVELGIEDANAHPEASQLAYHNAVREARFAVR